MSRPSTDADRAATTEHGDAPKRDRSGERRPRRARVKSRARGVDGRDARAREGEATDPQRGERSGCRANTRGRTTRTTRDARGDA
jgi:hypothetical protein